MAENVWEKGRLQQVLHPVGKRENGEARYRRANFDLLEWQKPGGSTQEVYVVPVSIDNRISGGALNLQEEQLGMEFGFYDDKQHIIEPFEADGRSDSWKSLHGFGYV